MIDGRWRPAAVLLLVSAVVAGPGIAGCARGIASDPAAAGPASSVAAPAGTVSPARGTTARETTARGTTARKTTARGTTARGTTAPGSRASSAGPFSAVRLRSALLTRVNGVPTVSPAASGDYASLPDGTAGPGGSGGRRRANVVRVIPAACAGAAMAGFDPAVLAGSPAAAATFKVGRNGVSEMLVASSARVASSALAGRLRPVCRHYRETVAGKIFRYTASESAVSGIGRQALLLNVRPAGASVDNLWSLVYRGAGFVGTVTVVGPSASGSAVRELGEQAYRFAVRSLA